MNKEVLISFVVLAVISFSGIVLGIYLLDSLFGYCPKSAQQAQIYQQQY
jgi:hypothetical protein